MLTIVFAYFYQDSTWNGNSRFGLIFSSVEEGRLQIDDYYNTQGTITNDLALANGHYYSDKAIGPAVIGAILYAPIHWVQQIFQEELMKNWQQADSYHNYAKIILFAIFF